MIKEKYPNEPMIVVAHNGNWWSQLPESSPIFKADIIMEASLHQYIIRDKVPGKSLTFNTSRLSAYEMKHVFEIRVYKNCFVLLALGYPKCLMGSMTLEEWRKVWVKPFGKKPYPVLDWDEIRRIAPEILPPAKDGFNRERVLLHGFARRYKEMLDETGTRGETRPPGADQADRLSEPRRAVESYHGDRRYWRPRGQEGGSET